MNVRARQSQLNTIEALLRMCGPMTREAIEERLGFSVQLGISGRFEYRADGKWAIKRV